jgi:hypothetical protein
MPKDSKGHGSNKRGFVGPRYQKRIEAEDSALFRLREKRTAAAKSGNAEKHAAASQKVKDFVQKDIDKQVRMIGYHKNALKKQKAIRKANG